MDIFRQFDNLMKTFYMVTAFLAASIFGMTLHHKCESSINLLSSEGVFIENVTQSRVDISSLMTGFTNGHELNFDFKTNKSNGVLFYLTKKNNDLDLVAVVLKRGYLRYHIRCKRLDAKLTVPFNRYDDRRFHRIRFRRKRNRGLLVVDGKRYFKNYGIDCDGFDSLTFGGIHPEHLPFKGRLRTHPHHFEGCIRNMEISTGISSFPHYTAVSECLK